MIKTFLKFAVIVLSITINLFPQSKKVWFPDDLNVQPFTANVIEAKAGFEFLLAKSEIRLNVGTSRDFYKVSDENTSLSFGADFFTYSLLRSERDFHFPFTTCTVDCFIYHF